MKTELLTENLKQIQKSEIMFGILFHLAMPNGHRKHYSSNIAYDINVTYCSAVKSIQYLESIGWITREKVGRTKFIKLTEKGKLVGKKLLELNEVIK